MEQEQGSTLINENRFVENVQEFMKASVAEPSSQIISEMGEWQFQTPGKMLRSRVVFRLGRIFEIQPEKILLWGIVCELLHNASLVHDDLQDGDLYRRGRESVWVRFGKAQAINFGDYLLVQPTRLVCESKILNDFERTQLNLCISKTITNLVIGQSGDIDFRRKGSKDRNFKNFLVATRKKTGTLFRSLGEGLSFLIENEKLRLKGAAAGEVLEDLGLFFQMVDDVLDLYGEKGRDKQGCDIYEGKYSFLVSMHQRFVPDDIVPLDKILEKSREETDIFDVEWFKGRLQSEGTLEKIYKYLGLKLEEIDRKILDLDHEPLVMILRLFVGEILKPLKKSGEFTILRENCGTEFDY